MEPVLHKIDVITWRGVIVPVYGTTANPLFPAKTITSILGAENSNTAVDNHTMKSDRYVRKISGTKTSHAVTLLNATSVVNLIKGYVKVTTIQQEALDQFDRALEYIRSPPPTIKPIKREDSVDDVEEMSTPGATDQDIKPTSPSTSSSPIASNTTPVPIVNNAPNTPVVIPTPKSSSIIVPTFELVITTRPYHTNKNDVLGHCIYAMYIELNRFKCGVTKHLSVRIAEHIAEFKVCNIEPVFICAFDCEKGYASKAETRLKNNHGGRTSYLEYGGKQEIYSVDDLNAFLNTAGTYINEAQLHYEKETLVKVDVIKQLELTASIENSRAAIVNAPVRMKEIETTVEREKAVRETKYVDLQLKQTELQIEQLKAAVRLVELQIEHSKLQSTSNHTLPSIKIPSFEMKPTVPRLTQKPEPINPLSSLSKVQLKNKQYWIAQYQSQTIVGYENEHFNGTALCTTKGKSLDQWMSGKRVREELDTLNNTNKKAVIDHSDVEDESVRGVYIYCSMFIKLNMWAGKEKKTRKKKDTKQQS